jgi:hypothetical protein
MVEILAKSHALSFDVMPACPESFLFDMMQSTTIPDKRMTIVLQGRHSRVVFVEKILSTDRQINPRKVRIFSVLNQRQTVVEAG